MDVIVPARAPAPWLAETIQSVLGQAGLKELIVVDDGSPDDSVRQAVLQAGQARCRLLQGEGRGPSAARNRGAAEASAPWRLFLDSDDLLEPDALANLLEALGSGAGLAFGSWRNVAEDGRTVLGESLLPATLSDRPLQAALTHAPPIPAALLPRSAVAWDEGRRVWEVTRYLNRVSASATRISLTAVPVARIRQHTSANRLMHAERHYAPDVQLPFWLEEYDWMQGLEPAPEDGLRFVASRLLSLAYAAVRAGAPGAHTGAVLDLAHREDWRRRLRPRFGSAEWTALRFGLPGLRAFSALNRRLGR